MDKACAVELKIVSKLRREQSQLKYHRTCCVYSSMTRFARIAKKKHLEATPWSELVASGKLKSVVVAMFVDTCSVGSLGYSDQLLWSVFLIKLVYYL